MNRALTALAALAIASPALAGDVEAIKNPTFVEELRFGTVDIFSAFSGSGSEDAAGEGDHLSQFVADGKHQAVAKAVIDTLLVLLALQAESGGGQERTGEAMLICPSGKCLPGVWGEAQAVFLDSRLVDAAVCEVLPCLGAFRCAELLLEESGGLGQESHSIVEELPSPGGFGVAFPTVTLLWYDDVVSLCQPLHCADKVGVHQFFD